MWIGILKSNISIVALQMEKDYKQCVLFITK
jgi:hypothetical protein